MSRALLCAFVLLLSPLLRAASPVLTLANEQIPTPAPVGASVPEFGTTPAGTLALTWQLDGHRQAATFNPAPQHWDAAPADTIVLSHTVTESSGEVLVRLQGRQAKTWSSPDPKAPAVLLATSSDAGEHFLLPVQIQDTHPIGRADLVLLEDGTVFAAWPEKAPGAEDVSIWLRRISPGGSLSVPVLLGSAQAATPGIALSLLHDFSNGPARLLVAYSSGTGDTAQIIVRLLTVDPASDAPRKNPCNCPDDDAAVRGYAIRGKIVSLAPDHRTLRLAHGDLPGVLAAGTTEFEVDPVLFQHAAEGTELFARIEHRDKHWLLFSPRLLVLPQSQSSTQHP